MNLITFYLKEIYIISKEESEKGIKEINEFNNVIKTNLFPFDDSSYIPNGQDISTKLLNLFKKGHFFQNQKG